MMDGLKNNYEKWNNSNQESWWKKKKKTTTKIKFCLIKFDVIA
jgi:hypothetical protein